MLHRRDTGPAVVDLQRKLLLLGYDLPLYGADASLGGETLSAAATLLQAHGRTPTPDTITGDDLALIDELVAAIPLFVDVSPWSVQRPEAWQQLADAGPPWSGAILKVSEGRFGYSSWFAPHWAALGAVQCERLWLRGAYGFWRRAIPGTDQAHVMLREIQRAGGLDDDDLLAIDVETSAWNAAATRCEVEDGVSIMAETLRREAGREVVLYAGVWLAQLGITSRLRCALEWYPSYTAQLYRRVFERIGWDRSSLLAWQGVGLDARGVHAEWPLPETTPIGDADINALLLPGGIEAMRARLRVVAPCSAPAAP
jgi:GH25 family lysozyme M1 (1,4-beta-N-acetylmuramidase)